MTVPTPVVTFSYPNFIDEFPEMAGLSNQQAQGYFNRATAFFANLTSNPAFNVDCTGAFMGSMLNLLTAHIAWLNAPRDANGNLSSSGSGSTLPAPGFINSASEGSVSVGLDIGDLTAGSPSQPWYMLSRYGQEYWYATAGFRTAQYSARPTIVPGTRFFGRRFA